MTCCLWLWWTEISCLTTRLMLLRLSMKSLCAVTLMDTIKTTRFHQLTRTMGACFITNKTMNRSKMKFLSSTLLQTKTMLTMKMGQLRFSTNRKKKKRRMWSLRISISILKSQEIYTATSKVNLRKSNRTLSQCLRAVAVFLKRIWWSKVSLESVMALTMIKATWHHCNSLKMASMVLQWKLNAPRQTRAAQTPGAIKTCWVSWMRSWSTKLSYFMKKSDLQSRYSEKTSAVTSSF